MYERTNYLQVGIFILVGAVALVAVGLWASGAGQSVPMSRYVIIFERDVNGLSEGSPVRYMGVDVGSVTVIRLFHAEDTAIEVQIEVAASTPVNGGTYATLAYQGITGVAFINLAADPGGGQALARSAGFEYPVIPSRDVGIAALLNSGPEIAAQLNSTLRDLGSLLSEDNIGSATRTLANVEQFTGALAEQRLALAELPSRMSDSFDQLEEVLALLKDITEQAGPDLLVSSQNLRQTTEKLASVSARVDQWLLENDAAVSNFLEDGIGETAALVADTRDALRELEKLAAELRGNPSRVIYKPQLEPVAVAQ